MRFIILALAALAAACGAPAKLHPTQKSATCTASALQVVPGDGAGPLYRMTPIGATWTGLADAVIFDVRARGSSIAGEPFIDDGRAVFLPAGPLPASSTVTVAVTACGTTTSSTFYTGAILHPLAELDTCVGQPFDLDLRKATLHEPKPDNAVAEVMLKWRLAPTLLVMLNRIEGDEATFVLVPGVIDDDGNTIPDHTRTAQVIRATLANNPYVALEPTDFSVSLPMGLATLRSVDLLLGLGEGGLEDGRLSAVVDLRSFVGVQDPCATVADNTGESCFPCDETDRLGSCFLLEMTNVTAVPSDARLGPWAVGIDIPTTTAPVSPVNIVPGIDPIVDPRITCPEGKCPDRTPPLPIGPLAK